MVLVLSVLSKPIARSLTVLRLSAAVQFEELSYIIFEIVLEDQQELKKSWLNKHSKKATQRVVFFLAFFLSNPSGLGLLLIQLATKY